MTLYNGITSSDNWPPQDIVWESGEPLPVPYLKTPPDVIPINIGRQLFVDDFLIAETNLKRQYHKPDPSDIQQVLKPESELEMNQGLCPMAAPFNDGVWFDPSDELYKLWYQAGWFDGTALATSKDGIHWQRPDFDVVPGTNRIDTPRDGYMRDGGLTWIDPLAPDSERYKMFVYFRWADGSAGELYSSADGVHWKGPQITSRCGDNTTFFYNPFLQKYVFSVRVSGRDKQERYRARAYHEDSDFFKAGQWESENLIPWARADNLDLPEDSIGDRVQLYDVNAVAYESIMIGTFAMFYGPQNPVCAKIGKPKIIDLQMAYSRDGFHWYRPDRTGFISCTRNWGDWNYGYIHAAGGVCLVVEDTLRFYFGTFSGNSPVLKPGETRAFEQQNAMYADASTGLATLRRDGFASMDAADSPCFLTTRPLLFSGKKLFVNADVKKGNMKVEVLDENQNVIEPYTKDNCQAVSQDSTIVPVTWRGAESLQPVAGKPVRFRFSLQKGSLYSFWVSADDSGASGGYVAAGGPGFSGNRDT